MKPSFFVGLLCVISTLILVVVVKLLYPYCQYYLDTDTVAYLQLTQHFAADSFYSGMSSLWNPLHALLAGQYMKIFGGKAFDALLWTNVLGATATIVSSIFIFKKFIVEKWIQFLFAVFIGIFWGINAYFQLTSDVFGVLGLNLFLLILLKNKILDSRIWNVLLGLVVAFSCFAKTYSFYIEVLLLIVWVGYLVSQKKLTITNAFRRISIIGIVSLIALLPWVIPFHEKYGAWNVSLAGKYNMTTRIMGSANYKDGIDCLIPPSNPGALSFWEDPHRLQGNYVGVFESAYTVKRYALRLGYNAIEWTSSISHLSILYGAIWLITCLILCNTKWRSRFNDSLQFILLNMMLFPVGLWLVHIEPRYMWYTLPIFLVIILTLIQQYLTPFLNPKVKHILVLVIFATLIIGPVKDTQSMINEGKEDFELAEHIKALQLPYGSFFTNKDYVSGQQIRALRLASHLQQPVYILEIDKCSMEEKLAEAKRYGINYYVAFLNTSEEQNPNNIHLLISEQFKEVTGGQIKGIRIFDLTKVQ